MPHIEPILIVSSVLALLSILASKASGRLGVPALLLFLLIGMLAGSEGPGGIAFTSARVAQAVGVVSLVLILFSGGLDTPWPMVRPVLGRSVALATLGVALSAALVGAFATIALHLPARDAVLLGAVVSATDAAAVFGVLRSRDIHLPTRLRGLLELESGSNDPMAVFLTVSLISLITHPETSLLSLVPTFFWQMGVGGLLGYLMGRGMVVVINRAQLDQDGLYPVLSLALVALTYSATALIGASGFLAVYVAGIIMGNSVYLHKRSLTRFHDGLAWLTQIAMFLTLGLLVFPSRIVPVIGTGLLVALFLMVVARPLSVFASLALSRFSLREQALVGWIGLRGAVPIILATFALVAGVPHAERIFNVVFFIVLASTAVQGTTIPFVARRLRIGGPAYAPEPIAAGEPVQRGLVEYKVPDSSPIVGREIARAGLPATAEVILVRRYGAYIVPTGRTRLRREDHITVLADDDALAAVDARGELDRMSEPLSFCVPYPVAAGDSEGAA